MTGEVKKLSPIKYVPFKIVEKNGTNSLSLDLLSYMYMYSVVNVENLKLYETPMIMEKVEYILVPTMDEVSLEYLDEMQEDVILDKRTRTSNWGDVEYFRVGLKGVHPSKVK